MTKIEEKYSWQLPITYSDQKGECITKNARFHLFKGSKSVCGNYIQSGYEEYESEYVLSCGEKYICKKCLKKYKEIYND